MSHATPAQKCHTITQQLQAHKLPHVVCTKMLRAQGLFAAAFCCSNANLGNPFCNILQALPGAALPPNSIFSTHPDPVPNGTSTPHLPTTYKVLPSEPPRSKLAGEENGIGIFLSSLPVADIITTCWAPPGAVVDPEITCKKMLQQKCDAMRLGVVLSMLVSSTCANIQGCTWQGPHIIAPRVER